MAEPSMSKDEFKEAKKAYKQARRAAGKTSKPLAIGVIVAVVIVAALSAGITWFFMSQQHENTVALEDVKDGETGGQQDEGLYGDYLGAWGGKLTSAESATYNAPRCYGAEGEEVRLDIQSISSSGKMKVSGQILFHGHDNNLASDSDSVAGDREFEFDDVTTTFRDQRFEFSIPVGDDSDNRIEVVVAFPQAATQPPLLKVKSYFKGTPVQTDTFTLEKQ